MSIFDVVLQPATDLANASRIAKEYQKLTIGNDSVGQVELVGFELPEVLPFGGDQRVVVTEFLGRNKREVQILGAQPRTLSWNGTFLYDTAIDRARYLDLMRIEGNPVTVQWGTFKYSCIIDHFHINVANSFSIRYEIGLTVIQQDFSIVDFNKVKSSDPSTSTEGGILDTLAKIQNLISIVQRAQAIATAIQRGDMNAIAGIATNLTSAIGTSLGTFTSLPTTTINTYVNSANVMVGYAKHLQDSITDGSSLMPHAEIAQLGSAAEMLAVLLNNFAGHPSSASVTIVRDNLFNIAQRYYGTTDAWEVIAVHNGITEAFIVGPTTIQLPPYKGAQPKDQPSSGTALSVPVKPIPPGEKALGA